MLSCLATRLSLISYLRSNTALSCRGLGATRQNYASLCLVNIQVLHIPTTARLDEQYHQPAANTNNHKINWLDALAYNNRIKATTKQNADEANWLSYPRLIFWPSGKNSRQKNLKTQEKNQTQAQNSIFGHILENLCLKFKHKFSKICPKIELNFI